MNYQNGFSLLELLLSLIILATTSLALLKQQGLSKQLLIQLELRAQASQLLDQVDESLSVNVEILPRVPHPYQLKVQINQQLSEVQIHWFKHSVTRIHSALRNIRSLSKDKRPI